MAASYQTRYGYSDVVDKSNLQKVMSDLIEELRTEKFEEQDDEHTQVSIPSGIERRRALEELGRHATGDPHAEIMWGLFLRNSRQYLGLFRVPNELEAIVGGLDNPIRVGHDPCSAWRRLAWGVGQWIKSQR